MRWLAARRQHNLLGLVGRAAAREVPGDGLQAGAPRHRRRTRSVRPRHEGAGETGQQGQAGLAERQVYQGTPGGLALVHQLNQG
ncbi:hypothetical protein [Streptomyces galbus]|uniref:hypothetical protein n=1 Tax=Streptomyces galbus TaxID=33898 RepID=UPI003EBCD39C